MKFEVNFIVVAARTDTLSTWFEELALSRTNRFRKRNCWSLGQLDRTDITFGVLDFNTVLRVRDSRRYTPARGRQSWRRDAHSRSAPVTHRKTPTSGGIAFNLQATPCSLIGRKQSYTRETILLRRTAPFEVCILSTSSIRGTTIKYDFKFRDRLLPTKTFLASLTNRRDRIESRVRIIVYAFTDDSLRPMTTRQRKNMDNRVFSIEKRAIATRNVEILDRRDREIRFEIILFNDFHFFVFRLRSNRLGR